MFENMKTIRVGVDAMRTSGLQCGVKINTRKTMTHINALCSPTSALEKKRMLSHLGKELRNPSYRQRQIYSRVTLGSHVCAQACGSESTIIVMMAKDGRKLIHSGEQHFSPTSITADRSQGLNKLAGGRLALTARTFVYPEA